MMTHIEQISNLTYPFYSSLVDEMRCPVFLCVVYYLATRLTDKPSGVMLYKAPSHVAYPSPVSSHFCQQVPDETQMNEDISCIPLHLPLDFVLFWHF